jgi:hypothetical protein
MKRITIVAKDYTGLLADVSDILAGANINIQSIDAENVETTALIRIVSEDAEQAYHLLVDAGFHVVSRAGLLVKLKDEAGALARVSRLLAEHQIDIRGINMVEQHDGMRIVALSCSDAEKAKELLGDSVI